MGIPPDIRIVVFGKRITAVLCFLLICAANANAESAFSLDLRTDIALSALAVGFGVSSFFIETPPSQIPDSLSRSDVNALDRSLMVTRYSPVIRYTATAAMVCMAALLPVLSLPDFSMNTLVTYGIMYAQAAILSYGTRVLMRNNLTRFRPYYHDGRELRAEHRHDSFPSGHTTVAFMSAAFFAAAVSQEHPDSRWKRPAIAGSYAFATGIGAMRMLSGMHFFTDVIAGAAIGSFYGWLIPYLHRNTARNGNSNFPVKISRNGLLVALRL